MLKLLIMIADGKFYETIEMFVLLFKGLGIASKHFSVKAHYFLLQLYQEILLYKINNPQI